jgi:putative nucleotidyltransferase with HDIG domain
MLKRVKQFVRGLFARLGGKDYTFIAAYLTKQELDLFESMSRYDCRHAVNVARYLAGQGAGRELIRVGLLHDIGKARCPDLTLTRRSVCVFLEAYFPAYAEKKAGSGEGKLARALSVHKNHPDLGARLLDQLGVDERFVALVRLHQNGGAKADLTDDLEALREADDKF